MNNEQWGNIELPGLSDDELLSKNWIKIGNSRHLAKDPEWIRKSTEGSQRRSKNESWRKNAEQGNIKRSRDPILKEKFNELAKNRKENNTEWRENHTIAMQKIADTEDWKKKHAEINYKGKEKNKPLMTEDGPFISRKFAAIHFDVTTQIIDRRMKKYPEQYYYISQEEYILLTGKDI